jgi:cystathionine gamma-synthase
MSGRDPATIVTGPLGGGDPGYGSVVPPLWSSDSYAWQDGDHPPPHDYARTSSPNRDMLIEALCALEGATGGAVTGSGQSASLLALLLLDADSRVVAPHDCYGGTYRLLQGLADQKRLSVAFVDQRNAHALDHVFTDKVSMVWLETPSNPLLKVTDIAALARRGHAAGALVVADNTLATPLRQRPLALGCDIVVHSTTKAINGHGDGFGGAVLAADPQLVERIGWSANAAGINASPQAAWQTLRGLRTLPVRIDRQEASAAEIARWLVGRPGVAAVHYPGLDPGSWPAGQMSGPGFMISIELEEGEARLERFVQSLRLITLASSLGNY